MEHLPIVLRLHHVHNVQALLMYCVYTMRSPNGPGLWQVAGVAMRMSLELGLHRSAGQTKLSLLEVEMRKVSIETGLH